MCYLNLSFFKVRLVVVPVLGGVVVGPIVGWLHMADVHELLSLNIPKK